MAARAVGGVDEVARGADARVKISQLGPEAIKVQRVVYAIFEVLFVVAMLGFTALWIKGKMCLLTLLFILALCAIGASYVNGERLKLPEHQIGVLSAAERQLVEAAVLATVKVTGVGIELE